MIRTNNKLDLHPGVGGGGTQQSSIWGGSVPKFSPLYPFRMPSIDRLYPFNISSEWHRILFNLKFQEDGFISPFGFFYTPKWHISSHFHILLINEVLPSGRVSPFRPLEGVPCLGPHLRALDPATCIGGQMISPLRPRGNVLSCSLRLTPSKRKHSNRDSSFFHIVLVINLICCWLISRVSLLDLSCVSCMKVNVA